MYVTQRRSTHLHARDNVARVTHKHEGARKHLAAIMPCSPDSKLEKHCRMEIEWIGCAQGPSDEVTAFVEGLLTKASMTAK